MLFYPLPILRVNPTKRYWIGQSYFVHPQTVLQISIPFQRSYIGQQQASCLSVCYVSMEVQKGIRNVLPKG